MGKRSDFPRRKNDAYQTPPKPILPVLPYLREYGIRTFAEPCAGEGKMIKTLEECGFRCTFSGDISEGFDALQDQIVGEFDAIITNPPWTREILHPMIRRFMGVAQTWLLFDSDWAYTDQSEDLLDHCSDMVNAHRVKWIEGTDHQAKDNCAWYRFDINHRGGPRFRPRHYRPDLDEEAEALI